MKDFYVLFLLAILIFFSSQTDTMLSLFSFIAYALFLFLAFFFFKIEFLAYLFFIIYMGAIVVLFLFVIMLIEFKPIKSDKFEVAFLKMLVVFTCFYVFLVSFKYQNMDVNFTVITKTIWSNPASYDLATFQDYIDIIEIGLVLYDCFLVLFINITMLFALGIISVVLLTKEQPIIQKEQEKKKTIYLQKLIY